MAQLKDLIVTGPSRFIGTATASFFDGPAARVPQALNVSSSATTTAGYTYGTDGVTTGTRIYTKWYVNLDNKVTALTDGMLIEIKIPTTTGTGSGVCITIDGTNFHPVVIFNTNNLITTHFAVNTKILLMYDSTGTGSVYGNGTGTGATGAANITGVWRVLTNYDSGNTYTSALSTTGASTAAKAASQAHFYHGNSSQWLYVAFAYDNTAASALTLNINGQGAKPIYLNGVATSSTNYSLKKGTYLAYYNGTNYYIRTDGQLPIMTEAASITAVADDTQANWITKPTLSTWWYSTAGQITDQPGTYGILTNYTYGAEVHQLWFNQPGGAICHRGANGNGWSGTWKTLLDSSNYTTYCATASHTHSYLPLSGGTVTGDLTVNRNVMIDANAAQDRTIGIKKNETYGAGAIYLHSSGDATKSVGIWSITKSGGHMAVLDVDQSKNLTIGGTSCLPTMIKMSSNVSFASSSYGTAAPTSTGTTGQIYFQIVS